MERTYTATEGKIVERTVAPVEIPFDIAALRVERANYMTQVERIDALLAKYDEIKPVVRVEEPVLEEQVRDLRR